jgi:wyosine [tRNA(Phe)-imidazoG37] synthetase (radical SAM superfamily)
MAGRNLIAAHFDHRRSYGDFYYVYPVISRRSHGVSIGVNLNPDKNCNFNCVYCEVDRISPARRKDVDVGLLAQELEDMLRIYQDGSLFEREPFASAPQSWRALNDIAFSGEGEPTTCRFFEQAVEAAWRVRESLGLEATKLVLITDAACLDRPGVQRGIRRMQEGRHEIWAKLDAGTSDYYHVVNRSRVSYARILRNIAETSRWCPLFIQSLFLRVRDEPPAESEIRAYAARLNEIQAQGGKIPGLQLYTMVRPSAVAWATALSDDELNHIAALVKELTGLPSQIYYGKRVTA